jgi:hypothetical protein
LSDARVTHAFASLSPSAAQVARMGASVQARIASRRRSLAGEWAGLFRRRPIMNTAWVLAASCVLIFTTPVSVVITFWGTVTSAAPSSCPTSPFPLRSHASRDVGVPAAPLHSSQDLLPPLGKSMLETLTAVVTLCERASSAHGVSPVRSAATRGSQDIRNVSRTALARRFGGGAGPSASDLWP